MHMNSCGLAETGVCVGKSRFSRPHRAWSSFAWFLVLFMFVILSGHGAYAQTSGSTKKVVIKQSTNIPDDKRPMYLHITAGDTVLVRNDVIVTSEGEVPISESKKEPVASNFGGFFKRNNDLIGRLRGKDNSMTTTLAVDENTDVTTFDVAQMVPPNGNPEIMLNVSMHKPFLSAPASALSVSIPGWGTQFSKPIPVVSSLTPADPSSVPTTSNIPNSAIVTPPNPFITSSSTSTTTDATSYIDQTPSEDTPANAPLPFTVEYQCLKPGTHTVSIALRFVSASSAAKLRTPGRAGKAFHHLTLTFTKTCSERQQSSRTHGLPGLTVSSSSQVHADVMVNGEATSLFRAHAIAGDSTSNVPTGPTQLFVIEEGVRSHTFSVEYRPPKGAARFIDMASASAVAHSDKLQVSVIGHAIRRHRLSSVSPASRLTIHLVCTSEEDSIVTIVLNVQNNNVAPRFSFLKRCGPADLAASGANTKCGGGICQFSIGSETNANDVVYGGVVSSGYAVSLSDNNIKRPLVNSEETFTDFFFRVRGNQDVEIDGVDVVATEPGIVVPSVDNLFKWTMIKVTEKDDELVLRVNYKCLSTGMATITLVIHSEEVLPLTWRKSCHVAEVEEGPGKTSPEGDGNSGKMDGKPAEPVSGADEGPIFSQDSIPGLAIALTTVPDKIDAIAVRHGVTHPNYVPWVTTDPLIIDPSTHFVSFFALVMRPVTEKETAAYADVRFGYPFATSDSPIVDAHVYGQGANGGLLSPFDDTYSVLSVSLHCKAKGVAWVKVSLPIISASNVDYAVLDNGMPQRPRAHRDHQHIEFFFKKECLLSKPGDAESDGGNKDETPAFSSSGLGGVGIPGLSIGLRNMSNEVVRDGLPSRVYFGQRQQENPDWSNAIIPENVNVVTLYLSYNIPGYDRLDDDLLIPSTVTLGAPAVISHTAGASPLLGGDAAAGATLAYGMGSRELTVTFNCNFKDMVPMTVTIPVEPTGTIVFTLPKRCPGRDIIRGARIPGLDMALLQETCIDVTHDSSVSHVGDSKGTEVVEAVTMDSGGVIYKDGRKCRQTPLRMVRDGIPDEEFNALTPISSPHFKIPADINSSSFIIRRQPKKETKRVTPIFGSEPMVQCLRPICRPTISHALSFDTSKYMEDSGKNDIPQYRGFPIPDAILAPHTSPIVIEDYLRRINITYNCIYPGSSPIQLTIPIYPDGAVSLLMVKQCGTDALANLIDTDGHVGERQSTWERHDETSGAVDPLLLNPYLNSNGHLNKNVAGVVGLKASDVYLPSLMGSIDVSTVDPVKFPENIGNVVYQGIPRKPYRVANSKNDDKDPEVAYKTTQEAKKRRELEKAAGITSSTPEKSKHKKSDPKNPTSPPPEEGTEEYNQYFSWTYWSSWLNRAGQQRYGTDELLSPEDYELLADIDPEQMYAIIPPSQSSSRFYISVDPDTTAFQPFSAPFVKSLANNLGQPIVAATVSGPLVNGANITNVLTPKGDAPPIQDSPLVQITPGQAYVDVQYKCLRPGYTSTLVVVPLVPTALGSVAWRVIKLCGGVRAVNKRWLTLMNMIYLLILAVPLAILFLYQLCRGRKFRKLREKMMACFEKQEDFFGSLRPTNKYQGLGNFDPDEDETVRGELKMRYVSASPSTSINNGGTGSIPIASALRRDGAGNGTGASEPKRVRFGHIEALAPAPTDEVNTDVDAELSELLQ